MKVVTNKLVYITNQKSIKMKFLVTFKNTTKKIGLRGFLVTLTGLKGSYWTLYNADFSPTEDKYYKYMTAGTYLMERISDPFGNTGDWLVIKGTKVGMNENIWRYLEKHNVVSIKNAS